MSRTRAVVFGAVVLAVAAIAVLELELDGPGGAGPARGVPLVAKAPPLTASEPVGEPPPKASATSRTALRALTWPVSPEAATLAEVLDAARASADDYDRWVGLRISALCAAVPPEPVTEETARVSVAGGEERQRAVLSAAQHAHRKITQFCESGDAWRYLAEVKGRKLNLGALGPSSRLLTSARPEERAQWAPVVLGSPQRYGAAAELLFDDILARDLPVGLRSDPDAVAFASDALSQRLLRTDPGESVTALGRCAIQLRCAGLSGLTSDQMSAIAEVVARIELNVREQRWSNL